MRCLTTQPSPLEATEYKTLVLSKEPPYKLSALGSHQGRFTILWVGVLFSLLSGCTPTSTQTQVRHNFWQPAAQQKSIVRSDAPRRYVPSPRYMGSAPSYTAYLKGRLLAQEQKHAAAIDSFKIALVHDASSAYLHTMIAQQYAHLEQWIQAVYWARLALQRDQSYAPAHYLLGRIFWLQRKEGAAAASFRAAIQQAPRFLQPYLELSRLLHKQNNQKARKKLLQDLIRHRPDTYHGYLFLAKIYQKKRDYPRALQLFQEALNRHPSHTDALYQMALIHQKQRRTAQAIRAYELLLDYQPEAWQARMEIAALFLHRQSGHDTQRARYHLRYMMKEATQIEPYERAFRIGLVLYERSLYRHAASWLRRAIRLHRKIQFASLALEQQRDHKAHAHNIRFYLALSLRAAGLPQQALSLLQRLDTQHTDTRHEIDAYQIEILAEIGRYEDARTLFHRLRNQPALSPKAWLRLSQAFVERAHADDLNAEILALKERLPVWKKDESALMHLGYLYFKQQRFADCEGILRKILKKSPNHAPALNFLGYLLAEQSKSLLEAERLVRKALKIEPNNPSYMDSLGWVYFQQGNFVKAEEALRDASEQLPRDPAVLTHLAMLYQRLGKLQRALATFQRARSLRPEPSLQRKIDSNIQALRQQLPKIDLSHQHTHPIHAASSSKSKTP